MALAAALATSTSYAIQPELTTVAGDLGSTVPVVSVVAGSAIVGYLLGLATLVPLVDHLPPNRLVAGQLTCLAAGLVLAAAARSPLALGAGLLVSGMCSSTGAQLSTLAGKHSPPQHRGRAVGSVTAGISAGILAGRIAGGALADRVGWRWTLLIFAVACVAVAAAAGVVLPRARVAAAEKYLDVIRSLPTRVATHRVLRVSAVSGALWFFSFSLVWVGLSLALALPPLRLSPTAIGSYSLAGLLGIVATRVAGALADRHGSPRVILGGLALSFVCTVTMVFTLDVAPVLLVTLALFDAGLFAAQVANQSRVLSIDPRRPAKFNSTYMVVYFVGGSLGTAVGGGLVNTVGWPGVAATAAAAIAVAAVLSVRLWSAPRTPQAANR
nr:MFS transporter [Actinopolymorpha cephalotaxi]